MKNTIGNEIENTICIPFSKLKHAPMSESMTNILFTLLLTHDSLLIKEMIEKVEINFLYKVLESRLKNFSYTLEDRAILFLVFQCQTPGKIMLYLWYLQYYSKNKGLVNISLNEICVIFPNGFPSNKDLNILWDNQKVNKIPDNMVDHLEYGESILQ